MPRLPRLRLLRDMVLVKPVAVQRKGTVIIPDTAEGQTAFEAGDHTDTFEAVVVATGPGDILLHGRCDGCGHTKDLIPFETIGGMDHKSPGFGACRKCGKARFSIVSQGRAAMPVKVGDRILCPRRAGSVVELEGERYLCFHAQQFCMAVLEAAA